MTSASINIVTGTPFTVTFNNGTNTFTITGGNFTAMFTTGAILTAIGGPPNGGYQQVVSSIFSGGNTVVTVSSYSTGTAYPGPATFSTGTGTIIWFIAGGVTPPPVGLNWTSRTSLSLSAISALATSGGTSLAIDFVGNVSKSINGGHSWTALSVVPDSNTNGVLTVGGSTWIYSGTAVNIDRSTNAGATWSSIATGITDFFGNSNIVTNGTGTWIVCNNTFNGWDITSALDIPALDQGETITQAVTGATAVFLGANFRTTAQVSGLSITGTPNATDVWTGNDSALSFTPTSVPTVNYTPPMAYSTNDGLTWTTFDPFKGGVPVSTPPIWNGSEFVAFVIVGGNNELLATSTNGITWTTITSSTALFGLTKFGSNYLAFDGNSPSVVFSSTVAALATNSEISVPIGAGLSAAVASSSLAFVFDGNGEVANSADGTTWVAGTLHLSRDIARANAVTLNAVSAGLSGHLVAVGEFGTTFASTNGIAWTYHYSGQTEVLRGIASGLGFDVAVGDNGTVLTSTNNTSWIANTQGSNALNGIALLNGTTFVAVGNSGGIDGTILASTTPSGSWSTQTGATTHDLYAVCGESSTSSFIVGDLGTILHSTSTPGTVMTWTQQSITYLSAPGFVTSNITGTVTSGTFQYFENITQAVTGATAEIFAPGLEPFVPNAGPMRVVTSTILGTPNATDIWTGNITAATFAPTSAPSPTASFTSGENVTQPSSGATATLRSTVGPLGPFEIVASSLVGLPNAADDWTGDTSGAQFSTTLLSLQFFPSPIFQFNAVASHGGTTVITGQNLGIATTTDSGATWTLQCIPGGGGSLLTVVYDTVNSLWITEALFTSADGISWSGPNFTVVDFIPGSIVSGVFTPGETITQTSSGSTASLISYVGSYLTVLDSSITGTPNATNIWTGGTSGATFKPTAVPVQQPLPNTIIGAYANNGAIGSSSVIFVGSNASPFTSNIAYTTDEQLFASYTAGGTGIFAIGETITQPSTGATATVLASIDDATASYVFAIDHNSITGSFDVSPIVGSTSGAVADVLSTVPDWAMRSIYDSTNNSFIAVGQNGSISTYP